MIKKKMCSYRPIETQVMSRSRVGGVPDTISFRGGSLNSLLKRVVFSLLSLGASSSGGETKVLVSGYPKS